MLKKCYTRFAKNGISTLVLLVLLSCSFSLKAQTVLKSGDVAFVGYITTNDGGATQDDEFSFILLKDIDANTEIFFTDFGWTDNSQFQSAENCGLNSGSHSDGVIKWSTSSVLTCGTQVTIQCRNLLTASVGTVTGIQPTFINAANYLSLNANNGDQIFAYQGSFAAPSFIAGISINSDWELALDTCAFTSARSILPGTLSSTAIAIFPDAINAVYNCVTTTGNSSSLLTALIDTLNWTKDTTTILPIPAAFNLPLACAFSGCALPPPSITLQPISITSCEGTDVSFSISALNYDSVQWQILSGSIWLNLLDTGAFVGSKDTTLLLTAIPFSYSGQLYRCVVYGQAPPLASSTSATLTVRIPPTIVSFTPSRAVCDGANVSYNVSVAGGSNNYTYQWQIDTGSGFVNLANGGAYGGATTRTVVITGTTGAMNMHYFRCIITGLCGVDTSTAVYLQVNVRPVITLQPVSSTICAGTNTLFFTNGTGSFVNYQWQIDSLGTFVNVVNSAIYNGAGSKNLSITAAPASLNGSRYRCVGTGTCNPPAITDTVTLTVKTIPVSPSTFAISQITLCQETDSVLYAIDPIPFADTYTWNFSGNNGVISAQDTSAYVNFGAASTSGTISVFATNNCGTGSPLATNVVVNPSYDFNTDVFICPGDSAFVGGTWFLSDTTLVDGYTTINGCDSIYSTDVIVTPVYNLQITANLCPGDSVFAGGAWQLSDGVFNDQFTTVNGCDSLVETTVVTNQAYQISQNLSICDNDSIFIGGAYQNQAGIYIDSLNSIVGCDSIVTTTLAINSTYLFTQNSSICNGDSILFAGSWITTSGTYLDSYATTAGCDSIYQLDLIVNPLPLVTLTLDTIVCSLGNQIQLYGESPSGGNWSGQGVTGNIFDPTSILPGDYIINYSYTDINGCIASASDTIIVTVCGGLNSLDATSFNLYPNPANELITIDAISGFKQNAVIDIYSIEGKLISTNSNIFNSSRISLNIKDLEAGLYTIIIRQNDKTSSLRFTKQ